MVEHLFILDDDLRPVPEPDMIAWARWWERAENRVIAATNLPPDIIVSTIFLGMDHGFMVGTPVLYETAVFGTTKHDLLINRYSTREEALLGHHRMVELVSGFKHGGGWL